jgi:hypothetical protein
MGYLTKGPTSNDPPRDTRGKRLSVGCEDGRWLEEDDLMDEIALLLSGLAERCATCRRGTRTKHLDHARLCPDCRPSDNALPSAEKNRAKPRKPCIIEPCTSAAATAEVGMERTGPKHGVLHSPSWGSATRPSVRLATSRSQCS